MVAKTNERRLIETPPASGRLFNEAAEVVNLADLVASILLGVGTNANPWEVWSGAGSGNAPTDLTANTIGFDTDGVGTSIMYLYNASNGVWTTTTQTFNGFIGV